MFIKGIQAMQPSEQMNFRATYYYDVTTLCVLMIYILKLQIVKLDKPPYNNSVRSVCCIVKNLISLKSILAVDKYSFKKISLSNSMPSRK